MLKWSLIFLAIALLAATFGFGGMASVIADLSQFLFLTFAILFVVTFGIYLVRGRRFRNLP